jgi:hypothetical protein
MSFLVDKTERKDTELPCRRGRGRTRTPRCRLGPGKPASRSFLHTSGNVRALVCLLTRLTYLSSLHCSCTYRIAKSRPNEQRQTFFVNEIFCMTTNIFKYYLVLKKSLMWNLIQSKSMHGSGSGSRIRFQIRFQIRVRGQVPGQVPD